AIGADLSRGSRPFRHTYDPPRLEDERSMRSTLPSLPTSPRRGGRNRRQAVRLCAALPRGVETAAPAIRSPMNASWSTAACLLVATFVALAGASPSRATSLPGGGPAASDCYVVLNVQGTTPAARPNRLECKDGDPQCDQDGDCHNGRCTFRVQVCIDQDGCPVQSALRSLQIGPGKLAIPKPNTLSGAACGD